MDGNLIQSSIITYKDTIIKEIVESKIFDRVIFIEGSFLNYEKYNVSSVNNKANLFISLTSGTFDQINNNNNIGLTSTVNITFAIVGKDDYMTQNLKNGAIQNQSSKIFLTSLYELVNILYNSQELKNISTSDISMLNYSFAYDQYIADLKLNVLILNASQKIRFLAPIKKY